MGRDSGGPVSSLCMTDNFTYGVTSSRGSTVEHLVEHLNDRKMQGWDLVTVVYTGSEYRFFWRVPVPPPPPSGFG
jgi:hypothetical protein